MARPTKELDHKERWVRTAARKYKLKRAYLRNLLERQEYKCARSDLPLIFEGEAGRPEKGKPTPFNFASVDHSKNGSDERGHEIVCCGLNDHKGSLNLSCFRAMQRTPAWRELMECLRLQYEVDPDYLYRLLTEYEYTGVDINDGTNAPGSVDRL